MEEEARMHLLKIMYIFVHMDNNQYGNYYNGRLSSLQALVEVGKKFGVVVEK